MSHRNVRLGIVYRGSIVKEEIIDREIDVSVGLRADSTVQFSPKDYPDFPDHLDVLFHEGGEHYLVVPSDPSARINLRGASQADNVETIRNKRCIRIGEVAGGSVVVGDVTVMFQFVRGYATPTKTHERTVLRIGLVYDERLISDRIFPQEKTISIGGSNGDTVVLDQAEYSGASLSFVNNKDGSVLLKAPADMKLRVAVQDQPPRDVSQLVESGKAKQDGGTTVAHLTLGARGRAVMGPYSILFQVVRQKVVVPTMEKKSLIERFLGLFLQDVVWTACFSIALLLGGGVVTQAVLYQRTQGQYLKNAKKAEEHVSVIIDVDIAEKEEPKEEEPEEEPKETAPEMKPEPEAKPKKRAKPDKKPAKVADKKPESTGKTVDLETRKRNARKVVAKRTIAGALMGAGGATTKLFAEGGEGDAAVVAKTFGGGDDSGDKGDGPGGGVKLAGGGGGGGTVEKVKRGKGGKGFGKRKKIATKKVKKKEKKIKISLSAGALGGSGAGKSGVARVIARKNSAVRRCYEGALRKTPGLSGKVKVRFTVGTAGTITSVSVIGASGDFATCIKRKFQRIRGLPLLPSPQSFTQSYVFTKN
ncbi:MAG: energy transducer TonB [Myxococcales bacterium]|nr:energy transducer TonB [Myxococcales bacterium]